MPVLRSLIDVLGCFRCCGSGEQSSGDQYLQPLNLFQPRTSTTGVRALGWAAGRPSAGAGADAAARGPQAQPPTAPLDRRAPSPQSMSW